MCKEHKEFTGEAHELLDRSELEARICDAVKNEGVRRFISPMCSEAAVLAAEVVISLRETYPDLCLECAPAYEEQSSDWDEALRDRYFAAFELCDEERLLATQYHTDCYAAQADYLKSRCELCIYI